VCDPFPGIEGVSPGFFSSEGVNLISQEFVQPFFVIFHSTVVHQVPKDKVRLGKVKVLHWRHNNQQNGTQFNDNPHYS
jgi:hypothetical protein